jgi:hypothetical protein
LNVLSLSRNAIVSEAIWVVEQVLWVSVNTHTSSQVTWIDRNVDTQIISRFVI